MAKQNITKSISESLENNFKDNHNTYNDFIMRSPMSLVRKVFDYQTSIGLNTTNDECTSDSNLQLAIKSYIAKEETPISLLLDIEFKADLDAIEKGASDE